MNVLIKLFGFRGGAPFSMRQYQNILHEQGHNTTVCGYMEDKKENENIFLDDTTCYNLPILNERSFINVIKTALNIFEIMKRQNIEFLISPSRNDFGVCRAVCRATGAAFLPVIPGGKIAIGAKNLSSVCNETFVCFSYENKEDLTKNGVPENNIHVISNRIHAKPDREWKEHYLTRSDKAPLSILLVSRLDATHLKGITSFMDIVAEYDGDIVLNIAGDGLCAEEFHEYAKKINQRKNIIYFLGYVKDINTLILKSDIIVGKGRSVITPIMTNRIGFVLGYDGGLSICDENTFDELYQFNFSGRGATHLLSSEQFFDMCDSILRDKEYRESFERVFEITREHYSVEYLPDKFLPIFKKKASEIKKVQFGLFQKFKTVLLAVGVYIKWLRLGIAEKLKG